MHPRVLSSLYCVAHVHVCVRVLGANINIFNMTFAHSQSLKMNSRDFTVWGKGKLLLFEILSGCCAQGGWRGGC